MAAIAVYSSKGGSGKSTLAIHVGVAAGSSHRVVLIDADPQRTLMMWASKRLARTPEIMPCDPSGIEEALSRISADRKAVAIVDCPPHSMPGTARLLSAVDHIVVPVQPTMPDLAATQRTIAMIRAAGKPFSFVLTRVPVRCTEFLQANEILQAIGPTAPTVIHDRRVFARALIESCAVTEVHRRDHAKAAAEVWTCWEWLKQRIKETHHAAIERQPAAVC